MLPRKEICHTQLLTNNNENKYMYIDNNEYNTLNFKTAQSEFYDHVLDLIAKGRNEFRYLDVLPPK